MAGKAQFIYATNNGTITIKSYTGSGGVVTIPVTINSLPVTSIGTAAFLNNANLISVTIPNSVIVIDPNAFSGCTILTSATIGTNVTYIGPSAFSGTSLTSIEIPNSVTTVGTGAFANCNPPNQRHNFYKCHQYRTANIQWLQIALTVLLFPTSVTNIGDAAFSACASLTSITTGTNVTEVSDRVRSDLVST